MGVGEGDGDGEGEGDGDGCSCGSSVCAMDADSKDRSVAVITQRQRTKMTKDREYRKVRSQRRQVAALQGGYFFFGEVSSFFCSSLKRF